MQSIFSSFPLKTEQYTLLFPHSIKARVITYMPTNLVCFSGNVLLHGVETGLQWDTQRPGLPGKPRPPMSELYKPPAMVHFTLQICWLGTVEQEEVCAASLQKALENSWEEAIQRPRLLSLVGHHCSWVFLPRDEEWCVKVTSSYILQVGSF